MKRPNSFFTQLPLHTIHGATVILDVDGTIVADRQEQISPEALAKIAEIKQNHTVFISSNGSPKNADEFARLAGVKMIVGKKPFIASFRSQIAADESITVIGDKWITDGLLARRLKADFIQVKRIGGAQDSRMARFSYLVDSAVSACLPFIWLARPWHWVKNLLVFAPIFFAGKILSAASLGDTCLAFGIFSLAASTVYILNDIFDREADALHPKKSKRPLAANEISLFGALVFAVALAGIACFLVTKIPAVAPPILLYVALNIVYSRWLKHVATIDVVTVASFYILRVLVGGSAAHVPLSPWIMLCTFFGALFVVVGKRRAELGQKARRAVLERYSSQALDLMLAISVGLAIISYGIWSIIGHSSSYLVYSTVFVVIALFRVLNLIYLSPERAESPDVLVFTDAWILGSLLSWAVFVSFLFYQKV